jgi:hypothetical protein
VEGIQGLDLQLKEAASLLVMQQARLLRDACSALDHCFERLGYGEDDIGGLLSDELFHWWQHEQPAEHVEAAQQRKYEAAMAEKRHVIRLDQKRMQRDANYKGA